MSIDESPSVVASPEAVETLARSEATDAPLWMRWQYLDPASPKRRQWLAHARRGAGQQAGAVPAMWPLYSGSAGFEYGGEGAFEAEHICLVLFGFHQQSKESSAHIRGRHFAAALSLLRGKPRFHDRENALDAKVFAAATATTLSELQHHLRSLVSLLKSEELGFDYTRLCDDLIAWQRSGGPDQVRRRWGRAYYAGRNTASSPDSNQHTKGTDQ